MTFDIPTGEIARLEANILRNVEETGRTLVSEINQRMLNVAGRMLDKLPPESGGGVDAARARVRAYMMSPVATRLKRFKSGRRKGKFARAGARSNQFMRVHLIAQAARKKQGKKGLYGKDMLKYSGKARRRSQLAIGYAKSVLTPVIKELNPLVKFKFPFAKTRNLKQWDQSSSTFTDVLPAGLRGGSPNGFFRIELTPQRNESFYSAKLNAAASGAMSEENADMEQHMEKRFQQALDKLK